MKQIISMFCSVNLPTFIDQNLRDFVLERESQTFNSNMYKLSAFVYPEGMQKHLGNQGLTFEGNIVVTA